MPNENIWCDEVGQLHITCNQTIVKLMVIVLRVPYATNVAFRETKNEQEAMDYLLPLERRPSFACAFLDCFNNFFLSMSYDYTANNIKLDAFWLLLFFHLIFR